MCAQMLGNYLVHESIPLRDKMSVSPSMPVTDRTATSKVRGRQMGALRVQRATVCNQRRRLTVSDGFEGRAPHRQAEQWLAVG
jgi:hypothetical protein